MAKPKKPPAKSRRNASATVAVEFDYNEASLLVVAANVLFGAAPDDEMQKSVAGVIDKLYKADPRLKVDARRVEAEMRGLLAPDAVDVDDVDVDVTDDEVPPLVGGGYLGPIAAAMDKGRALSLLRKDGVIVLHPTGMGQIGTVAVAFGWSASHEDYTVVRLDEVVGIGLESPPGRPPAANPVKASLDRLCRKPPTRGRLL